MTQIQNNKVNVFTRQEMGITTHDFLYSAEHMQHAVDDSASKIAVRAQIWKFKASKSKLEK